jgi:hypothetical protein
MLHSLCAAATSIRSRAVGLAALVTVGLAVAGSAHTAQLVRPPHGALTRVQAIRTVARLAVVTPDRRNVYTAGGYADRSSLHVYRRNPRTGALTRLSGKSGCILAWWAHGPNPFSRCARGAALNGPTALAATADGRNVVLGSWTGSQHVAVYGRAARSGALRFLTCVGTGHYGGFACDTTATVRHTSAIAAAGRTVYVGTGEVPKAVTIFTRAQGGRRLSVVGCVGPMGSTCGVTVHTRRFTPTAIAISSDLRNVYVTSESTVQGG